MDIEMYYTGHIYAGSAHESDNNCGTCDGFRCDEEVDTCRKCWRVLDDDGNIVSKHFDYGEACEAAGIEPPAKEAEAVVEAPKVNHYVMLKDLLEHINDKLGTPKYCEEYNKSLTQASEALSELKKFW